MKRTFAFALLFTLILSMLPPGVSALYFDAVDRYECEALTPAGSQGTVSVQDAPEASGGKWLVLEATQEGDFVHFQIPVYQRGLYRIYAGVQKGPDRGTFQLVFPDINAKVGEEQNLYSDTYKTEEIVIAEHYLDFAGVRDFKFRIAGKDANSTGYSIVLDYLVLEFLEEYKAIGATIPLPANPPEPLDPNSPYVWQQVTQGGTGRSTHIVFHPKEEGLVYMGTDMGGAYRWEDDLNRWTPITDILPYDQRNLLGIDGIAVDPQNPDVVYLCCGSYSDDRVGYEISDVLKSTDRGETWTFTGLNKKFAANQTYREYGECIAVDPNNSDIVIVATRDAGIYKSTDGAKTWQKSADPTALVRNEIDVRTLVFDANSVANGVTQRIYASVAKSGVYVSNDAGATWEMLNNSPKDVARLKLTNDGTLFAGAGADGLLRYRDGNWENISPIAGGNFTQVAVDPANPDFIVTNYHNGPEGSYGEHVYVTTDGGQSWRTVNDDSIYNHTVPRIEWGGYFANVSAIEMDPFNTKSVWMGGWQNHYQTDDILASPCNWTNPILGVEHGVNTMLLCPTKGARLLSSDYDFMGNRWTDPTQYPNEMLPPKSTHTRTAMMESDPNFIVRISKGTGVYSTDNGISWREFPAFPGSAEGKELDIGRVEVCATPHPDTGLPVIVIIPQKEPPYVSMDLGETWTVSSGAPGNITSSKWDTKALFAADKIEGNVLYLFAENGFYRSEDYGQTWNLTTQFDEAYQIKSAPNLAGEVWMASSSGLMRTSNGGDTFKKVDGFDRVITFGFGKEAPDRENPTVYVYGFQNGEEGIYRSVDMGETWLKIYGMEGSRKIPFAYTIEGDRQSFGVVYVGTSGRGIWYGAPAEENPLFANAYDDIRVLINNQPVSFDVPPTLISDRTMVPMRQIFEACGANVTWDEATETVTAVRTVSDHYRVETTTVELTVGSKTITVNGTASEIDVEPVVIDGRTLVPVRFIAQALGARVDWDEENQLVKIVI